MSDAFWHKGLKGPENIGRWDTGPENGWDAGG